jgi:hypothetical protein
LAETIWRLLGTGQTQQAVADELGWSREKVKVYASLQDIDERAWQIVGTTVRDSGVVQENGDVPQSGTTVPFTEGLLRVLVPHLSAEARAPGLSPALPLALAGSSRYRPSIASLTSRIRRNKKYHDHGMPAITTIPRAII